MVRDEKIERLVQIAGDLYTYLFDAVSIQQTILRQKELESTSLDLARQQQIRRARRRKRNTMTINYLMTF
jgi:hypothetical protein